MGSERQERFRRNEKLELLLKELNGILSPAEESIAKNYRTPRYPVILVMGAPRSGTTLMMQWLAQTGEFAYPTNLLSRFYGAPYIGAKIQLLLTSPEYNFRDELSDFQSEISFTSDLAKTKGTLQPNEFWYFWRRFIPNTDPEYLDEKSLGKVDSMKFLAELAAIESVFDKPFAMKGLILEFNIPFLSSIFEKILFLYIKRHPFYTIQSLLEARKKYYGTFKEWYSVKPKEFKKLLNLDPFEQVAGQVYYTNHAIEEGLMQMEPSRRLEISYEGFCQDPGEVYQQIAGKLSQQGYGMDMTYLGPERFEDTNKVRMPEEDCEKIRAAHKKFTGVDISS